MYFTGVCHLEQGMEQIIDLHQATIISGLVLRGDLICSQVLNQLCVVAQGLEQEALIHIGLHKVPGPTLAHTFCQGKCLLPRLSCKKVLEQLAWQHHTAKLSLFDKSLDVRLETMDINIHIPIFSYT